MTLLFQFARGDFIGDQPLLTAARVALEENPNPRMIRFRVDPDGTPIEIPLLDQPQPLQE